MPPYLLALGRLGLSEAQDDRIFLLLHNQLPVLREQERKAHQAVDALRQLASSDAYDPAKARELIAAHTQAVSTVLLQKAETDAAVRAVLTPEQRQQLDHLVQEGPLPGGPHPHHPPAPPPLAALPLPSSL